MLNLPLIGLPKEGFFPTWSFFFFFVSSKMVLKTDFLKLHKYSILKTGKKNLIIAIKKNQTLKNENLGKNSGTLSSPKFLRSIIMGVCIYILYANHVCVYKYIYF